MSNSPHDSEETLLDSHERWRFGMFPHVSPPPQLSNEILSKTTAIVRRSRWRRYFMRCGLAGVLYAAGILTVLPFVGRPDPVEPVAVEPSALFVNSAGPATESDRASPSAPTDVAADELQPEPFHDPWALRRQVANARQAERIRLLRQAGDLYLQSGNDLELALDCYRQALELMSPDERIRPGPDDSWLFAELKHARLLLAHSDGGW